LQRKVPYKRASLLAERDSLLGKLATRGRAIGVSPSELTRSFSSFPILKDGNLFGLTLTSSPVLGRLSKFFRPKIQSGKIILYMDTEVLREESYLDGKFFLKTNVKAKVLPTAEVVKSYKLLQEVERSFCELKDFLKIRPIFHYNDERVKAHVLICVPAYLFEKLIELQCRRASLRYSGRRALSLLAQFKAIECKVAGQSVTNRVDEEIRSIMDAIGFPIPSQTFENTNKV